MTMSTKAGDPLDIAIGARLRMRRRALGYSQQRLAEHLGVTFQQVQKYERGANRVAGSTLIRMAEALQAPPSYFLGEDHSGRMGDDKTMAKIAERGAPELLTHYAALESTQLRAAVVQLVRAMAEDYARPTLK